MRKPALHVYNWTDYMNPDLIAQFEAEFDCKVVRDFYDSNEAMFAKIKAGGGGYDVIFPSGYMISIMRQQGMLQTLDLSLIPNLKHIDPLLRSLISDSAMTYSVPYMAGSTGIGYLTSRIPDFEPTWNMFDRAALKGRMTLLNDMRETIGAALKSLGYSYNSVDEKELEQARDVVIRWKRNIAKFESDQYKNGLVSAEFVMTHGFSGDVLQVIAENEGIAFVVPQEGTSIAIDEMVIPATATQVKLAHAFINFMHRPEVAAANIEYVHYRCPNVAAYALLPPAVRNDPTIFLPDAVLQRCEVIKDLGEDNARFAKIWDEIKASE
ncbi:MAG TPA: spermidine/putrescine ABC transporter substrate-binding protein [Verrucomicrobia bacterium]|nr:spermidine/putrescine ABC transporter substrate-binding protein [Verrucomicrobiota bacterium]